MRNQKAILAYKKASLILELQPSTRKSLKTVFVKQSLLNQEVEEKPKGWHKFVNKVMANR